MNVRANERLTFGVRSGRVQPTKTKTKTKTKYLTHLSLMGLVLKTPGLEIIMSLRS